MKKMTNVLRNEKGAALIYVLMITMVIAIFVPVLLNMSTTSSLNMNRSKNEKLAFNVAASSMETFIAYLKAIPDTSNRITYFNNYSGWGQRNLPTPEGTIIEYKLYVDDKLNPVDPDDISSTYQPNIAIANPGRYMVTAMAAAGKSNKVITYWFDVLNVTGGSSTSGGVSSYNQYLNYIDNENAFDTNKDNVISWAEIQASTGAATFNDFFEGLRTDLIGDSYHYTFTSPTAMINFMRTNTALKSQTGQISISCECATFDFDTILARGTNLDFVTGYSAASFIVSFSNGVSLSSNNANMNWKMNGIILIDGNLSLEDRIFDVSNVVVNGNYNSGNGDKQDTYVAVNTYSDGPGKSTMPRGSDSTISYVSQGGVSGWNPAPEEEIE